MLQNRAEAVAEVQDMVQNYDEGIDLSSMAQETFEDETRNMGYDYAKKEVEKFVNDETIDPYETLMDGTFGAIELCQKYMEDEYGEMSINLGDPEKVANLIDAIRGEGVFYEMLDKLDIDSNDTLNDEIIKKIENYNDEEY